MFPLHHPKPLRLLLPFIHKSLYSPSIKTLQQAVSHGFLTTFPGLSQKNISSFLTYSESTIIGHSKQKTPTSFLLLKLVLHHLPYHPNHTFQPIQSLPSHKWFTDLTGAFPTRSRDGYKYIAITFIEECNAILATPMKSRNTSEWIRVCNTITSLHK